MAPTTEHEGKVEINLGPVLIVLEHLAEDAHRLRTIRFEPGVHMLRIPKDFSADFKEAAKAAYDYATSLPSDHPHRRVIDVTKVTQGYELIASGAIPISHG
jgi:hypothetical protein